MTCMKNDRETGMCKRVCTIESMGERERERTLCIQSVTERQRVCKRFNRFYIVEIMNSTLEGGTAQRHSTKS